jgi:Sec-independent protein translocase protein TatA
VSVMIIIIIVLVFGTTDLSRTCRRNVLELKGDQPDETQLLNEEIMQPATPR